MNSFYKRARAYVLTLLVAMALVYLVSPGVRSNVLDVVYRDMYDASGLSRVLHPGGIAVADFNGDGHEDILIAGVSGVRLYRNDGKARFTDVTRASGISGSWSPSGVFGDFDNDGCQDLYLTGSDVLYKNNCDGTFTDVTSDAGIWQHKSVASGAASATWGDYDNDGKLDLYVTNHGIFDYVDLGHATYTYDRNILYHNNGDGVFTDVTAQAGVSGVADCGVKPKTSSEIDIVNGVLKRSFQPVWFDFNNDGYSDLFVSTDEGFSPLYRNNKDGTFTEVTKRAGLCEIHSNMGIAVGDYNNDGNLDLYVTNGEPNNLWRNNGDGTFSDTVESTGLADVGLNGWGAAYLDYDNDGLQDVYVANGVKVEDGISSGLTPDKLYRNIGNGAYTDVAESVGVIGDDSKEKVALGDFDSNGFIDALVVTSTSASTDKSRLYMNRGNKNHWLTIRLIGTTSNRDGVGSVITVISNGMRQSRIVTAGESFQSQHSLWQSFGLGTSAEADTIEIRWPGNTVQTLKGVAANQRLTVVQE